MSDFQPYLQLSQTGHLIDDICERGFEQLHTLAVSGHYDHVMECLICLTPLFAEDEDVDSIPVGSSTGRPVVSLLCSEAHRCLYLRPRPQWALGIRTNTSS